MRKKYFWSLLFVMFLFGMPSAIAQYCVPSFSTGCSANDYIDDFIITDNSGNTVLSHLGTACSTNAYGDFTGDAGLQFQLEGNTTYNFKTTVGTSSDYVAIWIDLNNNQSFADPGEMVFQATNSANPSSPLQASFTVPKLTGVITTRMRVVVEWNTAPSDPCSPSSSYGEVQDYQVTLIGENPNCLSPKNVKLVSASPANGAKFSWDAVSTAANGYKWLVLNSGDDPATATPVQSGTVAAGTTMTTVSSLSTNTYYDFYVRSECSASDHSVWRSIPFFIAEEGAACSNPFVVNALPYTNSQNTGDFLNELSGTPGADCGVTGAYLDGNDVVYKYTADNDYILTVKLKDLSAANSAVFVYDECSDIGTQCTAAGSTSTTTADHSFKMSVVNGEDYYFVVSSAAPTASFDYTLSIDGFTCANYPAPAGGATQDYMTGQHISDLDAQGVNLTWYSDAALTDTIPTTTTLINNTTYYVTQTFGTCESSALAITANKTACSVLDVTSASAYAVCGEGSALMEAQGANAVANTKMYWYTTATGGTSIGQGEEFYSSRLTQTTNFYVAEVAVTGGGIFPNQGEVAPANGASQSSSTLHYGLVFDADKDFVLKTVDVYPGASGALEITLYDKNWNAVGTATQQVVSSSSPVTITLNFDVPAGDNYRLLQTSSPEIDLMRQYDESFPYDLGPNGDLGTMTGSTYKNGTYVGTTYYYFYNWKVSTEEVVCASPRKKVVATVNNVADKQVTGTLPYADSSNTINYEDNYVGIPGTDCSNENYLDGYEVIYEFTPTTGGVFSVQLSGLSATDVGMFIYKSCYDIGGDCYAGVMSDGTSNDFGLDEVVLNDGQSYFILISTKGSINTDYALTIDRAQIDCADYSYAPAGDSNQYVQQNSTLADLTVTGSNLQWYSDASLQTNKKLPETTPVVDGTTYYVTQKLNTCVSAALSVTAEEVDCSTLAITNSTGANLVCHGVPELTATASDTGDEVFWYKDSIGGEVVHRGENFQIENQITQPTTYWVSEVKLGNVVPEEGLGKTDPGSNISAPYSSNDYGVQFTANKRFKLVSVEVYSQGRQGKVTIELRDQEGNMLQSATVNVPGTSSTPVTVPLNFVVPGPGTYQLVYAGGPAELGYTSNTSYPYQLGDYGEITTGLTNYGTTNYSYYFFYNWTVGTKAVICESPRQKVDITVSPDGNEIVNSLPYTHSASTSDYANIYTGAAGNSCGSSDNYLNGDDAVYSFVAQNDTLINVSLTDITGYYAGVFIYDGCGNIGTKCGAGAVAGPSSDDVTIKDFKVTAGTKYYVVVSSWLNQSVDYTLDIWAFSCADVKAPEGEADQSFPTGDMLSSLEVDSTHVDATLTWYKDAALTQTVTDPSSVSLVDNTIYYVTQSFEGCESPALAITAHEIDCTTLAITKVKNDTISCRGIATLKATGSGTGSMLYWYKQDSAGAIIATGPKYQTSEITNTTSYWVSEIMLDDEPIKYGQAKKTFSTMSATGSADGYGLSFTAYEAFTILDVTVYSTNDGGDLDIELYDDNNNLIESTTVTVPKMTGAVAQPIKLPLNFRLPKAGNYYIIAGTDNIGMSQEYNNLTFPYSLGSVGTITGGKTSYNDNASTYYYFYNWTVTKAQVVCASPRQEVKAVVDQSGDFNLDYQDLPYTDSNNTALFGNRYSGDAGTGCKGANYLNGSETLYHYAADPQNDDILTIELSNVTNNDAAVFVYSSCGEIGRNCLAGAIYENGNVVIRDYYINAGEEITIVVSSATGSTKYDLSISGLVCNNVAAPRGDTAPYFGTGYTVADLVVKGSAYNTGFKWYSDSTLTTQITNLSSVNLVDGDTYYATQTIQGCESNALAISPVAFDCGALSVNVPQQTYYVCAPGGDIQVSVDTSGVGNQIYWYADSTSTSIIAIGEQTVLHAPQDTTYYVSEMRLSGAVPMTNIGKQNTSSTYGSTFTEYGLAFETTKPMMIETVDLFSMGSAGTLTVNLLDSNKNMIRQRTVNVSAGSNLSPERVTVSLNMQVPSPGTYYLVAGSDQVDLSSDYSGVNYPYAIGSFGDITGGKTSYSDNSSTYYYFYNWTVSTADIMCESPRTPIVIKVNDSVTPAPIVTPKHTICGQGLLSDIEVLGTDIQWYTTNGIAVPSNSPIVEGESYYVSQTLKGCESVLTEVIMDFLDKSAKPIAATNQPFLEGELLSDLDVQGKNLRWYEDQFMLHPLDSATTALVDQETYYVTQTRQGECESEPLAITVSRTLNVNSPEFAGIKMYPNPVETLLTIDNQYPIDQITVYDMTGRQVYVEHYSKSTIQIDFSNFASGAYFIKARIDGKAQVFRVIKK